MAQGAGDSNSSTGGAVESHHEGPEKASGPRYGLGDEAELPQDALPAFPRHSFGDSKIGEDLGQSELTMGRQLQGLADEVDRPARNDLTGVPAAVTLGYLLDRDGLSDGAGYRYEK